jgi:hypothetical protein
MIKEKVLQFLARLYELFCLSGVIWIAIASDNGAGFFLASVIALFSIPFFSRNTHIKSVAFSIILALLSFITSVVLIIVYVTDYMHLESTQIEHPIWEILTYLLPISIAVLTYRWAIKNRTASTNYELYYLIFSITTILLLGIVNL